MNISNRSLVLKYIGLYFTILTCLSQSNLSYAQFVPELIYPHPNEVTKESNITFRWNKAVYQTLNYQIQLASDVSFSSLIVDQTTSNNSLTINGLTNFGQIHYWRVRSINGALVSNWSTIQSFTLFSPQSISGLSVWLDPNSGTTLSTGNVQNLNDITSNANNAGQISSTQRPLFVSADSLINYKSIMRFDGVNDFLEIADNASIDFSDAFQAFVLVKPTVVAVNKTILAKWDYQTQGSWAWQTEFAIADELMFAPCFNITDPGNQKVFTTNADMLLLKPALLSLVYNGTQSTKVKFFKNTNALMTSTVNSIPSALPNSTATLKIGKYGGIATRYYQGDIGEILIYNNELGAADKYLVDSYLRYKYAPPVTLGPDTLMASNSVCSNIILKAQSVYQNYLWSTGATTSSITASSPGTYWVTVTDFLGNVSSDSVVVFPPFTMNLPSSGALCENTSIVWAPSYPTSAFTYLWQNGSTSPSFTITQAGSYYVKITDGSGCFIKSDTLIVTLDTYTSTASLGPDANLCSGNLLTLQVGAGTTVSYEWNGSGASGQPSSYQVNNSGTYFLESTNSNGCVAQDTINVTIVGIAPIANFSVTNVCNGSAAAFDDNSVPAGAAPIDGWQWDFGDTQTSNQQNPSHIYSSPGSYPVELYVSQGICGAYFYDTITVFSNPTVNFGYTGHCQGETIQFSNSSVAGSAPITNYYWDFGMPQTGAYNNSIVPIPNRIFDNAGTYNVEFTITDANGCKDSLTQILLIDPTPQVELIVENSCQNQEANILNATPTGNGLLYSWNFGDNSTSILPNPVKVYPLNGLYLVTLQVSNAFGCTGIQTETITINPEPIASFDVGPACVGSYGSLLDISSVSGGNIESSEWVINSTDTLYGSPTEYLWSTSGQQQIELTTHSNEGCSAYTSLFVDITDTLEASFQIGSSIAAAGDPINFSNTTIGDGVFLWNFGDGTFESAVSPSHTFIDTYIDSTVNVLLVALNSSGCIDSAMQSLSILEPFVDVSIEQLFLDESDGFYSVGVRIKNKGTSNVVSIPLALETEKGLLFNETFQGVLYPLADTIYVFNGKPSVPLQLQDMQQAFICVDGIAYSLIGLEETLLDDNGICENLKKDNAVVFLPIYPNPAESQINLSILVSENADVSLNLFDAQGRWVRQVLPKENLDPGIYAYNLSLQGISSGSYTVQMRSGNQVTIQSLLVQQ